MHFNLEVNYLLDPAHLEIRASCEKKAKPKKRFLEEAHCHSLWLIEFQMHSKSGASKHRGWWTHFRQTVERERPKIRLRKPNFKFPVHFRSMHFWSFMFDFMPKEAKVVKTDAEEWLLIWLSGSARSKSEIERLLDRFKIVQTHFRDLNLVTHFLSRVLHAPLSKMNGSKHIKSRI